MFSFKFDGFGEFQLFIYGFFKLFQLDFPKSWDFSLVLMLCLGIWSKDERGAVVCYLGSVALGFQFGEIFSGEEQLEGDLT